MVMEIKLRDTIKNLEVEKLRDRKIKRTENLLSSRHSLQVESLVDALAYSLAEVNVKTLGKKK